MNAVGESKQRWHYPYVRRLDSPRSRFVELPHDSPCSLELPRRFFFFFFCHPRNETQEVNRLLADPGNFAAWTRVAEDPDTMYLAKNIGDFLG